MISHILKTVKTKIKMARALGWGRGLCPSPGSHANGRCGGVCSVYLLGQTRTLIYLHTSYYMRKLKICLFKPFLLKYW